MMMRARWQRHGRASAGADALAPAPLAMARAAMLD